MKIFPIIAIVFLLVGCNEGSHQTKNFIAHGQMPSLATDASNNVHIVYGNGDSIMYIYSNDQGITFSKPLMAGIVPHLAASHSRGPQIAVTSTGLSVIACNNAGDIFSFFKEKSGNWAQGAKVNDVDTVGKEGLMGLEKGE
jgi:hypothetical protein